MPLIYVEAGMNRTSRKTIEGWVDKASNQLDAAREHSKYRHRASEAVPSSQQCVELSVKAVLSLLGVTYAPSHEWRQDGKEFAEVAKQIQARGLLEKLTDQHINHSVPLPRLLFLMNLWARFYLTAKYGFETGHLAPASELLSQVKPSCRFDTLRNAYRQRGSCDSSTKRRLRSP